MRVDCRVRTQAGESLEINTSRIKANPSPPTSHSGLHFVTRLDLGSNQTIIHVVWLGKSPKQLDNLKSDNEAVQPARWKMGGIQKYDGFVSVDLIHEYRTQGLKTLDQAEECERVIDDMAPVFGELHFILLDLYTAWGDLLNESGEFSKSKVLRMRIREQIEKPNRVDHWYYTQSVTNLVRSVRGQRWIQAIHGLPH